MIKNTKKFLKCNNEIIRNMIKCLLADNIPPPVSYFNVHGKLLSRISAAL